MSGQAIVFGAGQRQGISAAVAAAAARQGLAVVLVGRTEAKLAAVAEDVRGMGGQADYRVGDVTQPDQMRQIGADVVGMSTVPEVLAARERSVPVLALSVVSNVADPDRPVVADHAEVLEAGDAAAAKLEGIVRAVIEKGVRPLFR